MKRSQRRHLADPGPPADLAGLSARSAATNTASKRGRAWLHIVNSGSEKVTTLPLPIGVTSPRELNPLPP